MSSCHSCRGRSTRKKPGRLRRSNGRRRWISFRSRSTRSTRLRLTGLPSLRRTNAVALQQLVAPGIEERVRDLVLTAHVLHGPVAAQAGQHDLDLLLRRPTAVLALLAQPCLLAGRAAHPEPAAGQSLRRYAPPGSPGAPTQLL